MPRTDPAGGAAPPATEGVPAPKTIMVVDDNPVNLMLLEEMLVTRGYKLRLFPLGRMALAAAAESPPDLVLLDINMPEMDGYEVCERLKAIRTLEDVPVIFLSALNQTQDKVKAFRSGGVDFISKPFQIEEVLARVQTRLTLHDLRRTLKRQNESLEATVAARTRALAEANERLTILDRAKGEFLNLISHELRTPLNGLLGVGDLILEDLPSTGETIQLREMFEHSRRRILSILDDALLLTQIDADAVHRTSERVSLGSTLGRAVEEAEPFATSRGVLLDPPPASPGLVMGAGDLLVRAFRALLETAVKFSQKGETVRISRDVERGSPRVLIEGRGRTIPEAAVGRFFDLFAISEASTPGGDLGLGPPVASRILALFGASVSVANRNTTGILLTIVLKEAGESDG